MVCVYVCMYVRVYVCMCSVCVYVCMCVCVYVCVLCGLHRLTNYRTTMQVLEIVLSRLPYKVVSWIPQGSVRTWFSRFLFSPRHTSLPRHVFLTISLVTGSLAVGLTTDDLGVVLGFTVSGIFVGGRAGVHCEWNICGGSCWGSL